MTTPTLLDYSWQFGDTGVLLNGSDHVYPLIDVESVDGLDNATYRSQFKDTEGQDGGIVESEFESTRTITIGGTIYAENWASLEDLVDTLKENYAVSKTYKPFYFQRPGKNPLQVFCKCTSGFRSVIDTTRRACTAKFQITLQAGDPIIYGTDLWTVTGDLLKVQPPGFMFQTTLNQNATFEGISAIVPWVAVNGTASQSSAQFYAGASAARIVPNGSSATNYIESEQIPVTVGTQYTASTRVWVTNAVTTNFSMSVNWYDSVGALLSTSSALVSISAGVWTLVQNTFTAPANAAFATLAPTLSGTPAAAQVWYIDEARLVNASTGFGFPFTFGSTQEGPGFFTLTNNGNRPAPWKAILTGTFRNPSFLLDSSGEGLQLTIDVTSPDVLEVDFHKRMVYLNGASRRNAVNLENWFLLEKGDNLIRVQIDGMAGSGAGSGSVVFSFLDAWR